MMRDWGFTRGLNNTDVTWVQKIAVKFKIFKGKLNAEIILGDSRVLKGSLGNSKERPGLGCEGADYLASGQTRAMSLRNSLTKQNLQIVNWENQKKLVKNYEYYEYLSIFVKNFFCRRFSENWDDCDWFRPEKKQKIYQILIKSRAWVVVRASSFLQSWHTYSFMYFHSNNEMISEFYATVVVENAGRENPEFGS